MKRLTLFLVTVCLNFFGQKQGNIWYFGNFAGVSFNAANPTALVNGQLNYSTQSHNEGTSVIADSGGVILAYSDSKTIWNKNHQIMQNGTGLLGNYSSTQSSIIVPDPQSPNTVFYLFTVSSGFCCGSNISDGLRYSKINMCLDNFNGGIVTSQKNIKLVDSVAEKIAVTRHSNGVDYWVLTHRFYSNQFWALRLTASGITDTVITSIGTSHTGNIAGSQGQLKFSSNGQRIAIAASNGLNLLEVFDFNTSSGIVSNALSLYKPNNDLASIYGVEFSPDNSKLYASGVSAFGPMYAFLAQYDLTAPGLTAINASMSEIYHTTTGTIGGKGLQIGPDNKIYWISLSNAAYLASLNTPNILGPGCGYQDQSVSLSGKLGSYALPAIIAGYDYSNQLSQCEIAGSKSNLPEKKIILYPNPAKDFFVVNAVVNSSLVVSDALGKIMLVKEITSAEEKININQFAKGIYFIELQQASKVVYRTKIVKE